MGGYGGLSSYYWDFRAVCDGVDHAADAPAKLATVTLDWDPVPVLAEAFGRYAGLALKLCRKWSGHNDRDEGLRDAVSAACAWARDKDLDGKPASYVAKGLTHALEAASREAVPGTWRRARNGEQCPDCRGRGGSGCDLCHGSGKLSNRQWVQDYVVKTVPDQYEDDGGDEQENLQLAGPVRYPDDRPWHGDGDPETLVDRSPPPPQDVRLQRLTGYLLRQYLRHVADPVAAMAACLVLRDGWSIRDAAKQISLSTGREVSYWTVRRKLEKLLADLNAMLPEDASLGGVHHLSLSMKKEPSGGHPRLAPCGPREAPAAGNACLTRLQTGCGRRL